MGRPWTPFPLNDHFLLVDSVLSVEIKFPISDGVTQAKLFRESGFEPFQHPSRFKIAETRGEQFVHVAPIGVADAVGRQVAEQFVGVELQWIAGDNGVEHGVS